MTEPLKISEPTSTSLVRVEAFAANSDFSTTFSAAIEVTPPVAGQASMGPNGPVLWAEPKAWLVSGDATALEAGLSEVAAVSDVSGAWRRIDVTGSGWRELLMIDGFFDAEHPSFAPGCVAATVLHHAPVMLHVTGTDSVAVYVAPSFAVDLVGAFRKAV